jgi:flotillin
MHAPTFAALQAPSTGLGSLTIAAAGGLLLLALVGGLVVLFVSRYRRCPANKVLVISGRVSGGTAARVISGGGAFVWPVVQEYAYLDLTPIQIDIPLKDALSAENIRVAVPSVFTVAVGTDAETQQNAAARLLSIANDPPAIKRQAQDIIFGQLRQIIASMRIEEINRDRDALLTRIQTHLSPELKKIGLVLINVNITDLVDSSGYIEAIGKKAASQAVQQARGDVADQEKLGEIRVAEANREKAVQVANAEKEREIGLADAAREKAVRIAELEKERQVGEQTAAFERDAMVKNAEQEKRIAVAQADAKAIAGEATAQGEIAATQAQLAVKQAEAFQTAETRKREAEAHVLEAQNKAMARAALANAERVEAERRAELEAPAKAEKARKIVEAEAAAEQVKLAAAADADATRMRLAAQAQGEYDVLSKRAEALGELVTKAGGAQQAFALLMADQIKDIAKTAADAISGIKIDKVVVWDNGKGANGDGGVPGFVRGMASSLPPVMHMLRDITGVELPDYLGKMVPEGLSDGPVVAPPTAPSAPGKGTGSK